MRTLKLIFVVLIALSLIGIQSGPARAENTPYWPTQGWRMSTPEEQGMDPAALAEFVEDLSTSTGGFHSMQVSRHGYVVLDASPYPFQSDQPHALYKITKNVVTTLMGIAIDQGYVKSVNQSIWDYFPKTEIKNMDARKEAITIKHLLTDSSGLKLTSAYPGKSVEMYRLTAKDTPWVQFVLDQPMIFAPGSRVNILDANAHLASAIISKATGMSAMEFGKKYLFAPLGIDDVTWVSDPQGISRGGDNCYMSPQSLARIGYLYLRNGMWDGRQIVPSTWIADVITNFNASREYQTVWYSWKVSPTEDTPSGYATSGYIGEFLIVIPKLDMVVVTTGLYSFNAKEMLNEMILEAVKSDSPLPANPQAVTKLMSVVESLAHPKARAIRPMPTGMSEVSGKVYQLDDNPLKWKTFSFTFNPQEAVVNLTIDTSRLELPIGLDGIDRVSTTGMPTDPIWWPVADVPLAAKGSWSVTGADTFVFMLRDLRGILHFDILARYESDLILTVSVVVPALDLMYATQLPFSIHGTPQ